MSWLQFIGNSSQFGGSQLPSHLHPHPLAQGELVLCEQVDDLPEEHALECACELLLAIGAGARNVPLDGDAMGPPCGPRSRVAMKSMKHSDAIGWVGCIFSTWLGFPWEMVINLPKLAKNTLDSMTG